MLQHGLVTSLVRECIAEQLRSCNEVPPHCIQLQAPSDLTICDKKQKGQQRGLADPMKMGQVREDLAH